METKKLDEKQLTDDYPVYSFYFYVCDGEVVRSYIEGTVADLKKDLREYEGKKAKIITSCDIIERGLSDQVV